MTEGFHMKESLSMARARELNRTNEKRLADEMNGMLQDLRKKMEKVKVERRSTREFIAKLKTTSGMSKNRLMPPIEEAEHLENMIKPKPKMRFGFSDYKAKKAELNSHTLVVQPITSAREGNPVPLRTVYPWTSSSARKMSRKKPPTVAHPGKRRNSIESEVSSDEDDFCADLIKKENMKKKKLKAKILRRQSLPSIAEIPKLAEKQTAIINEKVKQNTMPSSTNFKRRHSSLT